MSAVKFSPEDSALISSLIALSERSPKLVKWSDYPAPADPSITVRSWKMNEFKYYDVPSPFPTLARGLYSRKLGDRDGGEERHRIVARGYDKFFNIGEVPWTTWPSLEAHTVAPYTLTLKSNGCIIFIAALTPTQVVVTSKHSLGPVEGVTYSHAQMGEIWLRKYLEEKGRTEEEFAKVLWERNWTAILELCDDSFEEHVLPYPPHLTGLHLHGLNKASASFNTEDQAEVDAFAAEWGFIRTHSIVLPTITAVREFTAKVGQTGKWEGEAVEGFVVRCRVGQPPTAGTGSSDRDKPERGPYSPGSSFFFKIKFDEPYLMYRDWREITKMMITTLTKATKNNSELSFESPTKDILAKLPKTKMKRPETQRYAAWVCQELKQELIENDGKLGPKFGTYTKGKGIIATRERFLAALEANGGVPGTVDDTSSAEQVEGPKTFGKTIIVPVAIPGCGKTAVSVALAHIFGFGHTQSDDITVKKAAPAFVRSVKTLLETHNVVIADKNNHLSQHRTALRDATKSLSPPVRLLVLNWNHVLFPTPTSPSPNSLSWPAIHRLASNRIVSRGTNHQSLLADETPSRGHEGVVWKFMKEAEDLTEGEYDAVVDMDLQESLEESVERAANALCKELDLGPPSKELVREGVDKAKGYVPTKKAEEGKEKKKKDVRYFAINPEIDLSSVIDKRLEGESANEFWEELKAKERVAKRAHVTITHNRSLPAEQGIWDACEKVDALGIQDTPLFWVRFSDLLWDGRVMALVVDDFGVHEDGAEQAKSFRENLPDEIRTRLHVTVGTLSDEVPPVEGMELVKAWRRGDAKSAGPGNGAIQRLSLVDGGGESHGLIVVGRLRGAFA
ncbi:RNA ligase [Pleurotus eryngii]|uniref:RNA ligase n=1 Tax=Pleurotus eryngii TaxID=5323 RepID=A0A9P6A072_PLEER|nr:RNA ligase [Pleurotus eryngii]